MPRGETDTNELLGRVATGDAAAKEALLDRHRDRLCHMVALRLDPRLTARVDPSDVVQEALAEASQKLDVYLRSRPLPFYPWLRQIAWQRLVHLHCRHIHTQKRAVDREDRRELPLPDQSAAQLADQLAASGVSPSGQMAQKEIRQRVRRAIEQLSAPHRDVIVMRHLEQLTFKEIAALSGITEAATQSRYRRAVQRLHQLLVRDPYIEDRDERT